MFGSTVLVPILVGLDPSIALFSSGVGTLVYILITRGKIPAYMGSSFSFITIMQALMKGAGYPAIAQGTVAVGVVYLIVALIVARSGSAWIDRALPPIVVGPIVMVIGLSLAGTAATDATMRTISATKSVYDLRYFAVAMITLASVIIYNMYLKKFISLLPILLGIVTGYVVALLFGIVDLTPVQQAAWFDLPKFELPFISYQPQLYWGAILSMAPIAFVTMTEHMGHIMVLNKLTKRDFFKDPGLNHTLAGDELRVNHCWIGRWPACHQLWRKYRCACDDEGAQRLCIRRRRMFAILFAFIGKLSALIRSIPSPVIGGISFLLFGVIASNGLRVLIDNKVDFDKKRNLMIASTILVIGIGNASLQFAGYQFSGLALATVIGIFLNFVLPEHAANEEGQRK